MAFDEDIKNKINNYALAHLGDEAWHLSYFDFIDNKDLARRLGQEFLSARYIYKLLEGLEADGWLLRSQIRLQIFSYASIYEAVLHHLLFVTLASEPQVISLTQFPTKKPISISKNKLKLLEMTLEHNGKKIIPTYEDIGKIDKSKVRFDKKAECAAALGLIKPWLKDDLVKFYEARNAIHIHAEISKTRKYQLDLSMRAYRRMQPFKSQIVAWQAEHIK